MLKALVMCLLIAVLMVSLPGCGSPEEETPVATEFGRMLGYIPASVFEEHDLWFGNAGLVKRLYGLEDIRSINDFIAWSEELKKQAGENWPEELVEKTGGSFSEAGLTGLIIARWPELYSLVGFDVMSVDRAIYGDVIPPHGFYVLEGDFDEAVIGQKLIEQGYKETDYGDCSYYGIRGDFDIDMKNPLGQLVLASMNRVAVLDDFIILSPVTSEVTGVFDAMAGDVPSVIDNDACRALAESLGEVLMATLTTAERVIYSDLYDQGNQPGMLGANTLDDWGTLRGYEAAAIGYRSDGDKRFIDIALYYDDAGDAEADGREIIKRMASYTMGGVLTDGLPDADDMAFITWWQPGEPVVTECAGGAVLKISCSSISEKPRWVSMIIGTSALTFRDALFLAPDPSIYVGIKDKPLIIYKEQ